MEVQRTLQFGSYALPAAPGDSVAPYVLSSQKLYVIGTTDGTIQPVGAEHLVGEMGGVWAHPVGQGRRWPDRAAGGKRHAATCP
jgi:hypothetical protein